MSLFKKNRYKEVSGAYILVLNDTNQFIANVYSQRADIMIDENIPYEERMVSAAELNKIAESVKGIQQNIVKIGKILYGLELTQVNLENEND